MKLRQFGPRERAAILARQGALDPKGLEILSRYRLRECADPLDRYAENVFAGFPMPWGVAEHFRVNGRDIPAVPMATEERTVVAAASKAAKLCFTSGFRVRVGPPLARSHVLLRTDFDGDGWGRYEDSMEETHREIIAEASERVPVFRAHGGGLRKLESDGFLIDDVPHSEFILTVDTGEAMGANGVTRLARAVGEALHRRFGWEPVSWICLNDNPERTIKAAAFWEVSNIGEEVACRVIRNHGWAVASPRRAVTYHKGIMNGIDAVATATGQDVRAIEAGASADAYRWGVCRPLTRFVATPGGHVAGTLKMQLTVGAIGGGTDHPFAQVSRRMMGVETAAELTAVMGAVGLAQNFAALAWALNK